mgnify:CR=1 FL=1
MKVRTVCHFSDGGCIPRPSRRFPKPFPTQTVPDAVCGARHNRSLCVDGDPFQVAPHWLSSQNRLSIPTPVTGNTKKTSLRIDIVIANW